MIISWHQCFRKAPFSKCFPSTSKRQAGVSNWRAFSKSKFLRRSVHEADKFRAPKTKLQPIRLFLMSYVHPSKCKRSGYSPKWSWVSWLTRGKNYFSVLNYCSFLGTSMWFLEDFKAQCRLSLKDGGGRRLWIFFLLPSDWRTNRNCSQS